VTDDRSNELQRAQSGLLMDTVLRRRQGAMSYKFGIGPDLNN